MTRVTFKTSTVFVAEGNSTVVYRSLEDVPEDVRQRIEAHTSDGNGLSLVFADRKGREEILRSFRENDQLTPEERRLAAERMAEMMVDGEILSQPKSRWVTWAQFILPVAVAVIVWTILRFI